MKLGWWRSHGLRTACLTGIGLAVGATLTLSRRSSSFSPFTITSIERRTPRHVEITVNAPYPEDYGAIPFHYLLKHPSLTIARPYTPLSDVHGKLRFIIKEYQDSDMTRYLAGLRNGETLEIMGPIGTGGTPGSGTGRGAGEPRLPPGLNVVGKDVLMVAGGTGVLPLLQLMRSKSSPLTRARSVRTILALRRQEDNFLTDGEKESVDLVFGRDNLRTVLAGHLDPSGNKLVLVCGSLQMTRDLCGPKAKEWDPTDGCQGEVKGWMKELGLGSSQVWRF